MRILVGGGGPGVGKPSVVALTRCTCGSPVFDRQRPVSLKRAPAGEASPSLDLYGFPREVIMGGLFCIMCFNGGPDPFAVHPINVVARRENLRGIDGNGDRRGVEHAHDDLDQKIGG